MSNISKKIASLPPEKLAAFAKKMAAQKTQSQAASTWSFTQRHQDEDCFPLSFEQQRLWFLHQLNPEASAYNIVNFLPILGTPDLDAAKQALEMVLNRHEVFRTTFQQEGDEPFQRIHASIEVDLPYTDLSHLPEAEQETEASNMVLEASLLPFDLENGPLLNSFIIQGNGCFFWVFCYHHIVTDWWSARIFYNEVMANYDALKAGDTPEFEPLQWQYADYAKAQRAKFTPAVLEEHISWWRNRLGDTPPVLDLPTDRSHHFAEGAKAAKVRLNLSEACLEKLQTFNRQQGMTTFMTVMAAVKALFHRYTGSREIILGSASANRDLSEIQDVVGLFVNTLVFHTQVTGEASFKALAKSVKQSCLDVYGRAELPFEKLVAALQPDRDLNRNPLFQVMFNLEKDFSIADVAAKKGGNKDLDIDAKFDLIIQVLEKPNLMTIEFEYNTGLFEKSTMQRWLTHLERLLEAGLTMQDTALAELPLLSETERQTLLFDWNNTDMPFPAQTPIHQLFEKQAAGRPSDIVAIFDRGEAEAETMTYAQLNQAANTFAHDFLNRKVAPGDKVALLSKNSPAFLAAILGTLKVGATYVPLDPAFPNERLRFMCEDCDISLILSAPGLENRLQDVSVPTLSMEIPTDNPDFPHPDLPNPDIQVDAGSPAYIMFTSGSTGRPKGALIPHRAITRLVFNRQPLNFKPGQRTAQIANTAFDATTFEIWLPLLHGGALVAFQPDDSTDASRLAAKLAAYEIDAMFITGALFNRVIREKADAFSTVKSVIPGGEALDPKTLRQAILANPNSHFYNGYGPTECTTFAVMQRIPLPGPQDEHIALGTPIGNTQAYVLDERLQPVPIGVNGELYLGGAGVALGYLNRAQLTQERFIKNPLANTPSPTLYKTGDLVRWQEDGTIRFLGRCDHQLKIRGFRIEPEEINIHLKTLDAVVDSAVCVYEQDGEKRLAAYVQTEPGIDWQPQFWRDALATTLPPFMVPQSWVRMDQLPMTATGKLDRRGLPAPSEVNYLRSESRIAPRTASEILVAGLFKDILQTSDISVSDDFFLLGGHSLLATQVVSQVRQRLGLSLSLREFFLDPTTAGLAELIDAKQPKADEQTLIPICDRNQVIPLSFAQQRLWFLDQLEPENTAYNMAETLVLNEAVHVGALQSAFDALIQRHESLRTRFADQDGVPIQIIDGADFQLEQEDFSDLVSEAKSTAVRESLERLSHQVFDLEKGPLLKAVLLRLEPEQHLLFLNMHHIISDGWSMRIFTRELFQAYAAHQAGEQVIFEAMPIQYADYAVWQRQRLSGERLEEQMNYWRQQLDGDLPVLDLPTDRPRPAVQSFEGALLTAKIPPGLTAKIKAFASKENATLYQTLLTGFFTLLHRYTQADDLIIGSPVANRNRAELEPLIGFFVNNLVLRVRFDESSHFKGLLEQVKEVSLGAYDYQDTPFEMLVDTFQSKRDLSRTPLFQVLFDFHTDMSEGDVSTGDQDVEIDTAICDLSLSAFETGDSLVLGAQYATALFDEGTIERMLEHFQQLLEAAVEAPQQTVAHLPLLTLAEQQTMLSTWNATEQTVPNLPVTRLFEDQVSTTPNATALDVDGEAVSYETLNTQANRWAHGLKAVGMAEGKTVGIFLDTGRDAIAAVLAVLKSGARYLPLDPQYPQERLSYLLENGSADLVLTTSKLSNQLPQGDHPVICTDTQPWPEATGNLATAPAMEASAYIIYTSGSTANPKGVVIGQQALSGYAYSTVGGFDLTEQDRILQFASLSFDVAVEEIFPTLLAGATLVIRNGLKQMDYREFTNMVADGGITGFELPTHFWSEWMAALEAESMDLPSCLRYCAIGTERVNPKRLAIWQGFDRQLFHVYGLTEVTVTSIINPFRDAEATFGEAFNLPIGTPQANTQVYVLDAHGEPVPTGVPGELYVGGEGLAFGYHHQPGLTAARFVPQPFANYEGQRLYRTGDQVRWLASGQLEFLGRMDHQVKIRGYRIEPAEIEEVLTRHDQVAEAVVVVRENHAGLKRLAAYVVPTLPEQTPSVSELRRFLAQQLPEFMVPDAFVTLEAMPVTQNGKIDRRGLPDPQDERPHLEAAYHAPTGALEQRIAAVWTQVLGVSKVGINDNFFELGGNSMLIVQVHALLRKEFGDAVSLVDLFAQPTVSALAKWISGSGQNDGKTVMAEEITARDVFQDTRVAVIGLAGRFTGSANLEEFWKHICDGRETIRIFSKEELEAAGIDPSIISQPNFVPVKGVLDDADHFDAGLFDIPPREAELMDPQHRIFLEHAWMALEHGGYDPHQYDGAIGVYAGSSPNYYYRENLLGNPNLEAMDTFKIEFGNYSDFMPERTSYLLNLRGASVNVQSACSTSLTAIAEAYYGILNGECDMALAGGSTVLFPQVSGYFYHESGIWSEDGHCRAFDKNATGLVVGEGVGVVMLKPLKNALEDGDNIHAVICGAAIKNEGSAKVGFAAPGVEGQSLMVRHAIEMADVDPRTIGLIEAHGSATNLGDPAEVAGLTRAWRQYTDDKEFCAIGSVKTNVGHADIAAGVAGFLKATLSLRDKVIPPSLHFEEPNPELDLENTPFFVPTELKSWDVSDTPRRAGVSSLGVGGTNTHVILEEAPLPQASSPALGTQLLVFSAKTPTALTQHLQNMAAFLEANPQTNLADFAYTLQVGRQALPCRKSFSAKTVTEAIDILRNDNGRKIFAHQLPVRGKIKTPKMIFLFSGQGSQYAEMGRGLYDTCAVFRQHMDRALAILEDALEIDPRSLFFPGTDRLDWAQDMLAQTRYTQPMLFSVTYAMAKQWMAWGVYPETLIGHSLGEYVAACLAGVMDFEDALRLVVIRGKLNQNLPAGAMTSVSLPEKELEPLLNNDVSIAAVNSPFSTVVSGTPEAVAALEEACDTQYADYSRLKVNTAFHSITQEPIREEYLAAVAAIELNAPKMPFWSCLTGKLIRPEQATDPEYWVDQMMHAVRYSDAIAAELASDATVCFLEVGPGRTLTTLARQQIDRKRPPLLLTSMRHPRESLEDTVHLLNTVGRLWLNNVRMEWETFYAGQRRRRLILPFYPFERKRYFIDPPHLDADQEDLKPESGLFKNPDLASWFYVPSWKRTAFPMQTAQADDPKTWLIFVDAVGLGLRLAQQLKALDHRVVLIRPGSGFAETAYARYTVNPDRAEDFQTLFEELVETGQIPDVVIHGWAISQAGENQDPSEIARANRHNTMGAIHIATAMDCFPADGRPLLFALTNDAFEITGAEQTQPDKAGIVGFSRVLPQEYNQFCRCIDVNLPDSETASERLAANLIADCLAPGEDTVIAYRGPYRYVETFDQLRLEEETAETTTLRQGGVYLMTGGQGYLGFELGAQLIEKYDAKLALVGHRGLPERSTWEAYLASHEGEDDKTAWKIQWALRLEQMGAEVLYLTADVADEAQMADAFARTESHFGTINGVFHAAGITDENHYHPIKQTNWENLQYQFAPKISGVKVLASLLAERQVDFCLNFSSIAAVLGGLGFLGYSAANNVLDSYTHQLNRDSETHWISVNWDGWLLEDLVEEAKKMAPDSLLALAKTLPEGLMVIERLLAHPALSQVVMSSGKLDIRIDRWVRLKAIQSNVVTEENNETGTPSQGHDRPQLSNAYTAPENEIEKMICGIWQELLGVNTVGIHDNFFELGGDSLLSVHLSTKITKGLGVQIPGGALLALQTVAEQAEVALEKLAESMDEESMSQILSD